MKPHKQDNRSPDGKQRQAKRKADFHSVHKMIGTDGAVLQALRNRAWWTKAVLKARAHPIPEQIEIAAARALVQAEAKRGKR